MTDSKDCVNHHQDNTRDQQVNTFTLIGSQLVVMVLRALRPLGTIAQSFHFVAEEKKKDDKKTKAFHDWATTGVPVITKKNLKKTPCISSQRTAIKRLQPKEKKRNIKRFKHELKVTFFFNFLRLSAPIRGD